MSAAELEASASVLVAAGESRAAATLLRENGWPYRRIAVWVYADMATVHRWLNPESAERNRAWHRRKAAEMRREGASA